MNRRIANLFNVLIPKRRWARFSLRSLLLLVTVLGVWMGNQVNRVRRQKEAFAAIREAGGSIEYDWSRQTDASGLPPDGPPAPPWLRRWLGDEYFQSIVKVYLKPSVDAKFPMACLEGLDRLQELLLLGEAITDDHLAALHPPRSLVDLNLNGSLVSDAGLEHLVRFPNLKRLVRPDGITDRGLHCLRFAPHLESLSLSVTPITDAGLEHIAALRELRELELVATAVTDEGMARIADLTALEKLNLVDTRVTDAGLAHLSGLTRLRELQLPRTITDLGLAHLSGMKELRVLWLTGTQTTSAGVKQLTCLKQLETLGLPNTLIDDNAIEHLEALPNLKELTLLRVMVSQAAIDDLMRAAPQCRIDTRLCAEQIERCKQEIIELCGRMEVDRHLAGEPVVALDLSGLNLDKKTLNSLQAFTRLRTLNVANTGITDYAIGPLAQLTRLRELNLTGTQVSTDGIQRLQQWLPQCEIVR